MITNKESSHDNNFIGALGLLCLLSILSSELKVQDSFRFEDIPKERLILVLTDHPIISSKILTL
jgi:hypothetical protein